MVKLIFGNTAWALVYVAFGVSLSNKVQRLFYWPIFKGPRLFPLEGQLFFRFFFFNLAFRGRILKNSVASPLLDLREIASNLVLDYRLLRCGDRTL